MQSRPKKIPRGLKRSEELSKAFHFTEAEKMHSYLAELGFKREPGQWSWKRGKDRAYNINPGYGLFFLTIYVETPPQETST